MNRMLTMASKTQRIWNSGRLILIAFVLFLLAPFLMIFSIFWAIAYFESTTTPEAETTSAMIVNELRIFEYIRGHGTFPKSLSELPVTDGKGDSTEDGWGRPIKYTVETNGLVTLLSLGSDGKPGGSGQEADIVESFQTKDVKGNWIQP